MTPLSRIVRFQAAGGKGPQLAQALLDAAAAVTDADGCEAWDVHRDAADADAVYVVEQWASAEQCDAALQAADGGARAGVLELVAGEPQVTDAVPLGGARQLRGTRGATVFSILEAPDLSQDAQLLDNYDLRDVSEARYVRRELEAVGVGLTHYRLPGGRRLGWAHRHANAEEIYVVIDGSIELKVDDDLLALARLDAARVAPASVREFEAGPDGAEVLVFGSHVPGDGELVANWWPA